MNKVFLSAIFFFIILSAPLLTLRHKSAFNVDIGGNRGFYGNQSGELRDCISDSKF